MSSMRILGTAMITLALVGCTVGPPVKPEGVEVRGKVLLPNGSPLTGGVLILRPVGGIHGASAQVQADGTFTLTDPAGKQAVVPGKYQVFVRFNDPSQKALSASINKKYQDSEDGDSDILVEIQEPKKDLIIRLKQ